MEGISQAILTDGETLEMLNAFYAEGLRFLEVPRDNWAEVKMGVSFNAADGKASLVSIDGTKGIILVCLPVLKMMVQTSPYTSGDAPSFYRSQGYKLARIWQQYLKTGKLCVFEQDKDSCDFAMALSIIKGLPQIDIPIDENLIKAIGFNPLDRDAAIRMLRDEFGIDCKVVQAYDQTNKEKRPIVTLTEGASQQFAAEQKKLYEESISLPLPKIVDGELGSKSNPFQNVDDAAAYILQIEKERLAADPYRQAIDMEQYYYDGERGYFRISWASPHVSYYPFDGTTSSSFVVNQLSERRGHHGELPRFSIKPTLANNKFLFRGQSQFFEKCVPGMFRVKENVACHQYVEDVIQINELEVLLRQHPLVKLFEQGFYLLHEYFRFRVDYQGLAQHYYGHTPMLDLTSDMDVAKFFAVTWFNMKDDRYEKYTGDELGVLYYYDLAPDAFTKRIGRDYMVETIGKQPFMRSGNQSGFLIRLDDTKDFNQLPEVRYVFFRHDATITDRIFAASGNGDKYMPQEMLRTHWHQRMNNEKARKEISIEALELNYANNPKLSHSSIRKELQSKGYHISSKNKQCFSEEELDQYYSGALEFWNDFCSNIHIYSPEGALLHKHLLNLPDAPRYRRAFFE